MRRAAAAVVCLTLIGLGSPASAAPETRTGDRRTAPPLALADRDADRISDAFEPALDAAQSSDRFAVLATFRPGTASPVAEARRSAGSFTVEREFSLIPGFAAEMTAAQVRALSRNPNLHRVEEDIRITAALDYARADFGIERARADYPAITGSGVDVCVADTGVDPNHEQLNSKAVAWKDTTPGPLANPADGHGHGTHVASILLGDGTGGVNADKLRGVAPAANLFAVKVLEDNGSGEDSWIIAGIEWCVSRGVDVISMSIGTTEGSDGADALSVAVNNAVAQGVIVVVAAGNSGDAPETVGSPGAAVGAITVGAAAEWSAPPGAPASRHSDGVYLAPFSSRGPTVGGGAVKPDVAAPGHSILAASAGTTSGYQTLSGTSMATPFVAGTLALARQADPALGPATARALVEGTAQDRGPAGKDNDWGAGLLDGYAVVAEAAGAASYTPTMFPSYTRIDGSVGRNGLWRYEFTVAAGDLDVPIAGAVTSAGNVVCVLAFGPDCFAWEWSPDLEARLVAPNGAVLSESTCAAGVECGVGRQETVHAMPTVAGTYAIEVWPFADWPNDGKGGSFALDLSRGPAGVPAPPGNQPPVANAGADQTTDDDDASGAEQVTLNGSGSSDADGSVASWSWSEGGSQIATGPAPVVSLSVGVHAITLTVTDDGGATDTDSVVATVNANRAPSAGAGPDQILTDTGGDGTESATLNGTSSTDPDGSLVSYVWREGGSQIATGAVATLPLAVGTHTITLTVTDNGGATSADTVVITVTTAATMHVSDLDGAPGGKRNSAAVVTIEVRDSAGALLSGVTVTGAWSGGTTASCTTGANGRCSVTRTFSKKQSGLTFTVTGLTRSGYTYAPGANADPDGDSDGTAVTVTKP